VQTDNLKIKTIFIEEMKIKNKILLSSLMHSTHKRTSVCSESANLRERQNLNHKWSVIQIWIAGFISYQWGAGLDLPCRPSLPVGSTRPSPPERLQCMLGTWTRAGL